jgi:glycosyltransferase involved in cell wall biosynthesis
MDVFRSSFKKHDKSVQKVLYNGIDPSPFLKQENLDIFREFDLPAGSLVMGMIGSFNDVRDHITVCKALKKIIEQKPEVHFLFIGRFSLCNKFYSECYNFCEENNLSDKVRFVGERNDVANLLNSLHLYVHSSNTDTFGIALVEAMAAKSPCLASDIPPFREVSDNGKYLTLFKKGDVDDLFKKINLMLLELNNKELSLRCEKAQQFAIKNFSIQAHLDNLHSYYREILKK